MAVRAARFYTKVDSVRNSQRTLIIDGVTIHCSESVSDLGHNVSTNDKDSIAKSAEASYGEVLIFSGLILGIFILL